MNNKFLEFIHFCIGTLFIIIMIPIWFAITSTGLIGAFYFMFINIDILINGVDGMKLGFNFYYYLGWPVLLFISIISLFIYDKIIDQKE